MIIGYFFLMFFLILMGALLFVFWLMMLIDVINRKFKESNDKVIWVMVNIFVGILGALIYYFVIYNKDKTKSMKWFWWTLLALFVLVVILGIITVISALNQRIGI